MFVFQQGGETEENGVVRGYGEEETGEPSLFLEKGPPTQEWKAASQTIDTFVAVGNV